MKMEVLPVQNQFMQRQFGALGTNRVQVSEWITPPSSTNHSSSNTNNNNNTNNRSQQIESEPPIPILSTSPQEDALQALTLRLQNELRVAKQRHLECTEVLLPSDLLHRIAEEMFVMSEKEPCGIRGCSLFIEFEDEPDNTRRIASLKTDPNTVSTFELYLTLKHDRSGWTSILPQFLKNLARGSTIMISPEYKLTKTKLYRSFSE
ncbi:protein charybde-like [Culicoides brevitarsis]|uniref:protein charybde-like n=1 Tax=Culicoides brevitarsis TaxID=469753 RepID=UPI00307B11CF